MPVGLNPKYEKSSTRQKLVHGPAVFNNSGKIILESNNLGNLFRNYKHKNTTQIKQVLKKVNAQYLKNVQNMARQVKNARAYGLSSGNVKHKYVHNYWNWLTRVIPVIYRSPSPVKPLLQRNVENYGKTWRKTPGKTVNYGNTWRLKESRHIRKNTGRL